MASLPSLIAYLDSLVTSALEFSVPTAVSESLLDTLEALNTPSTSHSAPLRPLELANALAASSPSRRRLLASSEQQDAHELWGMIRDAVEEEAGKLLQAQERQSQVGAGLAEALKMRSGLGMTLSRRKTGRGRNDPWFFLRSQRIKCMTCGYVRDTRHEGEELLMLQVPPVVRLSLICLEKSANAFLRRHTAPSTTSLTNTPKPTFFRTTTANAARCWPPSPDSKPNATVSSSLPPPLLRPLPRNRQTTPSSSLPNLLPPPLLER